MYINYTESSTSYGLLLAMQQSSCNSILAHQCYMPRRQYIEENTSGRKRFDWVTSFLANPRPGEKCVVPHVKIMHCAKSKIQYNHMLYIGTRPRCSTDAFNE